MADNGSTRIAVLTPTTENNTYWPQVYEVLDAVAEDLGIELLRFEFDVRDRYAKATDGERILRTTPDLDGGILSVAFGQTEPLLLVMEERSVPVIIQGPLFESELPNLGTSPRNTFQSWIGYVYQDEEKKGYLLGKTLIEKAVAEGLFASDGHLHVAGIGGDATWFGSALRARGLERAVEEEPRARLLQVVPTQWTPAEGREKAALLLQRYPETTVIWAASDQLAIGAAEGIAGTGNRAGTDILVGGLDLSKAGLEAVVAGTLAATTSGSLLSYATILIYLYDYIHGYDFTETAGTDIRFHTYTATGENAREFLSVYRDIREIDFQRYSRVYHPEQVSDGDTLEAKWDLILP